MAKNIDKIQSRDKETRDKLHGLSRYTIKINAEIPIKKLIEIPILIACEIDLDDGVPG
jgi:hypothetical protein